mmetsp:Transcript_26721/g.40928  ORF Transcript_26721/g.40928 Transcript_26721/m.40928 type:complete len:390 (-) Transcript_26721:162-1331(-)
MACCSSSNSDNIHNDMQGRFLSNLQQLPLAFTSSSDSSSLSKLTPATCRLPFTTSDGSATLNVEGFFFGEKHNDNATEKEEHPRPLVLYVHGICESSETSGVQRLARAAKSNGCDLAVLELEGHGLSSGSKCVCGDFDRMIQHVVEFMNHVLTCHSHKSISISTSASASHAPLPPYAISGTSLGGVLAVYAAHIWSKKLHGHAKEDKIQTTMSSEVLEYPLHFLGAAPIAPAVGVDPRAVPPSIVVGALKMLSALAPSSQIPLTPLEDPSHYNCPKDSTRNFSGHWPLATSKMLLDVTSRRVSEDQQETEQILSLADVPSLLIFAGEDDMVVPHDCIQAFYEKAQTVDKELIVVPNAGHDIMFQSSKGKVVTTKMFEWIQSRVTAILDN